MKKIIALTSMLAGALLAAAANAGPFGLPDHEPDGYRDTGCDTAANVEVRNAKGDLLYVNNATCPKMSGSTGEYVDGDMDPTSPPTWVSKS